MENTDLKHKKYLYPLALLYCFGVWIRNKLYDWGVKKVKSYDVPIISIGNIAVGGTGKTPHTEMIIDSLKKEFCVAVLSRGYKRKTKGFLMADANANATTIGDEPYQIYSKYDDVIVAVDEDRCRGVEKLMSLEDKFVQAVVLDDAFQHRKIKSGLSILLTEYDRMFCDDRLMPVGRLREPIRSKERADIVIVTKCPNDIKPIEYNILSKHLNLFPYQLLFFSTIAYVDLERMYSYEPNNISSEELKNKDVLLVTAIASDRKIFSSLKERAKSVVSIRYSDHHYFTSKDVANITKAFKSIESDDKIIVITEKDATKLKELEIPEEIKAYIYIQPIKTVILQDKEEYFNKKNNRLC